MPDDEIIERMLPRVISREGFDFLYEGATIENKLYDDGENPPVLWLYFYTAKWVCQVGGIRLVLTGEGHGDTVRKATEMVRERLTEQGFIVSNVVSEGAADAPN